MRTPNYLVIDIETTGFHKYDDDILSFGFIRFSPDWQIASSGTLYFYRDHFNVESNAQQIHGLTREFLLQHKHEFILNLSTMYTLMHSSIIVGKNSNEFDIPRIIAFLQKYAPDLAELNIRQTIDIQHKYMPLFRDMYLKRFGTTTKKKGTLGELVEMENVQDSAKSLYKELTGDSDARLHDALYDGCCTYLLLKQLVTKYAQMDMGLEVPDDV